MADKDVNIHIRAKDADTAKRDIDKTAQATENLGKKTEQAGKKTSTTARAMTSLASAAKAVGGSLLAMVSIKTLFEFFRKWLAWIEKINQAQKNLVESTRGLDQASKALASQANIMGTEAGMEGSREDVLFITEAGDTTIAMGGAVGVATHSAFGESGKRLTPEQREIAGVVAGFAQRKDLSETEAGQLLKLLSAMGVGTVEEARHRIQQLSSVQQASQAQFFKDFIGGATKAMVPRLAAGASVEGALSSYAKGLDIDAGDPAAEKMKQMAAHLQNEKILQAMGKEYGMSEVDIRNMPFDERIDMFSGWVSKHAATGVGEKYLLESGLSGEQLNLAKTLYTKDMLQRRVMFKGLAEGATADQFSAQAEGYGRTTQGQIEALESAKERITASATPEERIGLAIVEAADKEWEFMLARGKGKHFGAQWAEDMHKRRHLVRRPLLKRAYALPHGPEREAIMERLKAEPVSVGNPFTIGEVGEVDRMLRQAERQYEGQLLEVAEPGNQAVGVGFGVVSRPRVDDPYANPGAPTVINNEYHDHSVNLNRPGMTADELGMSPRVDPNE